MQKMSVSVYNSGALALGGVTFHQVGLGSVITDYEQWVRVRIDLEHDEDLRRNHEETSIGYLQFNLKGAEGTMPYVILDDITLHKSMRVRGRYGVSYDTMADPTRRRRRSNIFELLPMKENEEIEVEELEERDPEEEEPVQTLREAYDPTNTFMAAFRFIKPMDFMGEEDVETFCVELENLINEFIQIPAICDRSRLIPSVSAETEKYEENMEDNYAKKRQQVATIDAYVALQSKNSQSMKKLNNKFPSVEGQTVGGYGIEAAGKTISMAVTSPAHYLSPASVASASLENPLVATAIVLA